jgi:hypothetical protein
MTVLQFGLTPKAKPVSPNRSALVAALDVGTGKVACLIARLKPQATKVDQRILSVLRSDQRASFIDALGEIVRAMSRTAAQPSRSAAA